MSRLTYPAISVLLLAMTAGLAPPARAQSQFQFETDLMAKRRVFSAAGSGLREIRRGPNGNYYILSAPGSAVQIYDPAGKPVGQIPSVDAAAKKGVGLLFGESFDLDREGRVAVCDGGARAVKLYAADGSLVAIIPVAAAASIALLPGGEIAVANPSSGHLITVYDFKGNVARQYGDTEEIADRADINLQVNIGHLATDAAGNTYFAFDYLPEPTVRKFDPAGYLINDISITTLEFQPAAQAARRAIARVGDRDAPSLHRIITAIGVDPQTQDVWLAIGTLLMHFDKDGLRLASFRTHTPEGARLESSTILVEPDRLLIGADPLGIYEFPRPDKLPQ